MFYTCFNCIFSVNNIIAPCYVMIIFLNLERLMALHIVCIRIQTIIKADAIVWKSCDQYPNPK